MANYLINLFKKAPKGDSYRTTDTPDKYVNGISALNASGANKNGTPAARVSATAPTQTKSSGNSTLPGQ